MRVRAVLFALLAGISVARAGTPRSAAPVIDRAKNAISSLARNGLSVVHAEIASIKKGQKASFSRELEAGSYATFAAVKNEKLQMGLELTALDASGKAIKKTEGVMEAFIQEFAVSAKGTVKIELEATDATGTDSDHYILVLLQKGDSAASPVDIVFERLADRAKAQEEQGREVVYGEIDTLAAGKTWTVARKLDAANYGVEVVSDDERVKDLEVAVTDGSGASVAKKEKSKEPKDGHMVSLKGDAKAGESKVAVTAVFQEGSKDGVAGVLIAKK